MKEKLRKTDLIKEIVEKSGEAIFPYLKRKRFEEKLPLSKILEELNELEVETSQPTLNKWIDTLFPDRDLDFLKTSSMFEVEERIEEPIEVYLERERFEERRRLSDIAEEIEMGETTVRSWCNKFFSEKDTSTRRKNGWGKDLNKIENYLDPLVSESLEKEGELPSSRDVAAFDSGLASQIRKHYEGLRDVYKRLGYLPPQEEIPKELPKEIKRSLRGLSEERREKFNDLVSKYPLFVLGRKKDGNFINFYEDKTIRDLLFKSNTIALSREAAIDFLNLYNEECPETDRKYKFEKSKYNLHRFLYKFDTESNSFKEPATGTYSNLIRRLEDGDLEENFLSNLTESLKENVKAVINDNKLCEEVAKNFIDLYNSKDPETRDEFKIEPEKYNLKHFLHDFNPEKGVFEEKSSYYPLYKRLRKESEGSPKIKTQFLNKLPKRLRKGIKYIISDKKLIQEASREFVNLYHEEDPQTGEEYRFEKKYKISRFFQRYDSSKGEFVGNHSYYNFLIGRMQEEARKKGENWKNILFEKLPEDSGKKVKEIISGKKLLKESIGDYIKFLEESERDISFFTFTNRADIESMELRDKKRSGRYYFVFSRLDNKARKSNSDWKTICLDMLEDYPTRRSKLKNMDPSFQTLELGYDPSKSKENLKRFIESKDEAQYVLEFFGGDERDVADVLSVMYPGLFSAGDLMEMFPSDGLSEWLAPVNEDFDSIGELVETGSQLLPYDKEGFVADLVYKKAKDYVRDELGPHPFREERLEKLEELEYLSNYE